MYMNVWCWRCREHSLRMSIGLAAFYQKAKEVDDVSDTISFIERNRSDKLCPDCVLRDIARRIDEERNAGAATK